MASSTTIIDMILLPTARGPYGNLDSQPEHVLFHRVCGVSGTTSKIFTRGIGTRTFFSPKAQGTFNFKALPAEIRNDIYRFCVAPGVVFPLPHGHEQHFGIDPRFATREDYEKPSTALFRLDHQIREEALAVYVDDNKFIIPVGDVFTNIEFIPVEYLPLIRSINVAYSARDLLFVFSPIGLILRKSRVWCSGSPVFEYDKEADWDTARHFAEERIEAQKLREVWEEKSRFLGAAFRGLRHLEIDIEEASCGMAGLVSLGNPLSKWSQRSIDGSRGLVPKTDCCRHAVSAIQMMFTDRSRRGQDPRIPPATAVVEIQGAKNRREHTHASTSMRAARLKMERCTNAPMCGCCPFLERGPLNGLTLSQYTASLSPDSSNSHATRLAMERCAELWGPDTEKWDKAAETVEYEEEDNEVGDLTEPDKEFREFREETHIGVASSEACIAAYEKSNPSTAENSAASPPLAEQSIVDWNLDPLPPTARDFWDYHYKNELDNLPSDIEIPASFWRSDFVRDGLVFWDHCEGRTEGRSIEY